MKAVAVTGGSPETPETEGTKVPGTDPGTQDTPLGIDGSDTPERAAAETPAEADGATEPGPEGDAPTEPAPKEADAESAPEAVAPEHAAKAKAKAEVEAEDGGEAGETAPEAETQLDTEADPAAPKATGETAPESEADSGNGSASGAESDGGTAPEPEAESDGGVVREPDAEADGGSASEAKAAGGTAPESEAESGNGSASGAESEGGVAAEPDAEADGGAVPGPEAEVGRGDASDAKAAGEAAPEPETDSGKGSASDAKASGGDVPGPEVKGGREGEGGGGSGEDEGAPDEDEEEAEGDEPTEAGPAGDAGREPRPVPSWARDGEADAERTSQFVALKELDAPAQKAPWPQAVPQNRTLDRTPNRTPNGTPAPARTPAPAPAPAGVVEPTREVPQPPLDLLAELTNTAPPAETPRRTAVRRVKIWTPVLLLLAGAAIGAQLLRPLPAPQLVAAERAHTLDGQFSVPWPAEGQGAVRVPGSGDIGTFGEQKPVPTASVAKVMTAYVIVKGHPLRKGEPGPQIEIDAKAVADGTSEHESRIEGLVAGTKFSQQDMLKMLMIPSGNNVARLLARWDAGTDSEAAFVEKMNAAARELGMENTTYTDPSGLDAGTVSTAADQLKLAEAVMKDEAFRGVVALPTAEIKGLSTKLYNNNSLLTVNGLSVRGIKTGSSTPAGGTLMWAAYKSVGDETPLILGTLMDQHVDGPDPNAENSLKLVLANSKKIIEAVRQALASAQVIRKGQTVGHVDDGLGGRTPLVATKDLKVIGVPGQQLKLTLRPGTSGVPHHAKAGTEIGVLTAGDGEGAKSVPVAVGTELAEPSFGNRVTRLR
ncbi:serine hydrolase [Streptomyces sp. NPDC012746]|uniref:serine hydrolase n=1 Tax=Streptomyces sp. NPDC012746 TaxID=3364845 RepID=UPI0036C13BC2